MGYRSKISTIIRLNATSRDITIFPVISMAFILALWSLEASISILLVAMLATWLVFPVTVWLGARPMSARQRDNALLLWLLKDFDSDRLRGSEAHAREPDSDVEVQADGRGNHPDFQISGHDDAEMSRVNA